MQQENRERIWNKAQDTWQALKGKRIFLTGGTGFFGKSLLDLISYYNSKKNLDLNVTILARNPEKFKVDFSHLADQKTVTFLKGDILNFEFINSHYDYIMHFATPASATFNKDFPLKMFDIVSHGSRRVLEFAEFTKTKTVLLASSGAVYGRQPDTLTHIPESYLGAPETNSIYAAYGEAKRTAELFGNLYSEQYGFEHKIARCFAFVGPYLDPNGTYAIGNFLKNAVSDQNIIINGDGTDCRSYLYSDDLIFYLFKILIFGKNKQPYNVGSDQSLSIFELANTISKLVNKNIGIELKQKAALSAVPNRYVPNVDLIKNELQLTPSVSLEEAIIETAAYFKSSDLG